MSTGAARLARRADLAAVAALWAALVEEHAALDPAFALEAGAEAGLPAEAARILEDPAAALWVWEGAEGVAGFCAAQRRPAPAAARERARVEITELAVAPAARRRGAGRALVAAALAWAAAGGARRIEVRVAARNPAGQAFWRALGFADFVDVLDRRL
ncbi:MAG: GNAT family N-acetyltransferase [Deltaproteobacteria bacterium]|nr:GNAT family N-acetyltransferase [Deltaproteobacteria bacterium]